MVYYHIRLSEQASNSCRAILPLGKYQYKRLPMGVSKSPGNFQEKMNEMFCGFEFIWSRINDMLTIAKGDWSDNLYTSKLTLNSLKTTGLILMLKSHSLNKQGWNI